MRSRTEYLWFETKRRREFVRITDRVSEIVEGSGIQEGLCLAIEPMLIGGGTDSYHTAPDGWTLRTNDGTRAAHVEHTVAITENGPRVLTARQAE